MSENKKISEQTEQAEVRELSLDEMDNIAGGSVEQSIKRNQEQSDK